MIALGLLVMLFTQYFAVGAVAGLLAATWLLPWPLRRRVRLSVLLPFLAFALCWGPMICLQWAGGRLSTRDENTLFLVRMDQSLIPVAKLIAQLPARVLHVPRIATANVDWLLGGVWLVGVLAWWRLPALRVLLLFGAGVVALPIALDLFRGTEHLRQVRYIILAGIPVAALVAAMPLMLPRALEDSRPMRLTLFGLPLTVALLALTSLSREFADTSGGYRVRADAVAKTTRSGEPLLFLGNEFPAMIPRTYMLEYSHLRHGKEAPRPIMVARTPVGADALQSLAGHSAAGERIWALTNAPDCVPTVLPGWQVARWQNLIEFGFLCELIPPPPTTQPTSRPATRVSSPTP